MFFSPSYLPHIELISHSLECTGKAVENRLYSWKKKNVSGNSATNTATNTPSKAATGTPKTPRSRTKITPRKKKVSEEVESDGPEGLMDDDDDDELLSPSAARGKRGRNGSQKPKYDETSDKEEEDDDVEDTYVPMAKRVKEEPIDEEVAFVEELVEEEI
jgi:hypothetical protein